MLSRRHFLQATTAAAALVGPAQIHRAAAQQRLTQDEINQRFRDFKHFTHFEEIPFERAMASFK